jgi:hypothetical protein
MKSGVMWLDLGDEITKLFHQFANHRKNVNTIWELSDDEWTQVWGLKNLVQVGVHHFANIYKEPKVANIAKVVKVCSFFPCLVSDEGNEALFEEITLEELARGLFFQKEKFQARMGQRLNFL